MNFNPPIPITANPKDSLYGIMYLCLATFFWALIELLGGLIPVGYSASQTVWMRYTTHLIFMLAVFGPSHGAGLVRTQKLRLQLLRPLLMVGMPICFILGVKYMSVENVLAEFWVAPLIGVGLAVVLLGERPSFPRWAATVIGLGGVWLMLSPDRGAISWKVILPLGMAFCFSLYCILTRMLRSESTVTNLFYTALIVLVFWSWRLPFFWQELRLQAAVLMVLIGLLGYVLLLFLDKAYERAPASVLAPFTYSQPIFMVILAYLFFDGVPSRSTILGSLILIGIGVYLLFYEVYFSSNKLRLNTTKV